MLCIPVTAADTEAAILQMHRAKSLADAIEIRLDYIREPVLERLFRHRPPLPVIATCRPEREGGQFRGSEEKRLGILRKAEELGADYVDVEMSAVGRYRRGKAKLIVSFHDFSETPEDLEEILERLASAGGDIVKVVTTARSITDNVRVLRLLREAEVPMVAFCMGRLGQVSRVLAEKFGSVFTLCSLESGKESAPGQLPAREMRETYRAGKLGEGTAVYGLIGNPVEHSGSPCVHNAAFDETGFDAVYVPFEVTDLGRFLGEFRELGARGYSVTVPHKEGIIAELDSVDEMARAIGAVNTVFERNGRLVGTNTDWKAAMEPLEKAAREKLGKEDGLRGLRVAVVGAGGAARAIVFGLKERDARVVILNRTATRARSLAEEIGASWGGLDMLEGVEAEVMVNATSVGMYPKVEETPVPASILRPGMLVFDVVYNPAETRLLREARERGCATLGGMEMFVGQAAMQFEIWTGKAAPREVMQRAAEGFVFGEKREESIFLIGYRCTGKSVVGQALARALGRGFVDTDEVIEKAAGKSAREVFSSDGEEFFRDLETAALGGGCEGKGRVVAVGGGAVLRQANIEAMKEAGKVILLKARAETIRRRMAADPRTKGLRPSLTAGDALSEVEEVLEARREAYERAADWEVETDGVSVKEVVGRIAQLLSSRKY